VKRLAKKPFALVGVNSDPDLPKLKARMEEEKITWRSFWNGPEGANGPISAKWRVAGWPTIFVLDHKGVIRDKNVQGAGLDGAVDTRLTGVGGGR
jgi:hypothetical protein